MLGANLNHLSKAMQNALLGHGLFWVSLLGMQGVWIMFYGGLGIGWALLAAALPAYGAVMGGVRALSEVRSRRLAGER